MPESPNLHQRRMSPLCNLNTTIQSLYLKLHGVLYTYRLLWVSIIIKKTYTRYSLQPNDSHNTVSLFQKIVHQPDHLLPGYESAVNFFWHRRCITIPNNTALIMDICGQYGMKKRFIYVHYVFIDGIAKLKNKSCYIKL